MLSEPQKKTAYVAVDNDEIQTTPVTTDTLSLEDCIRAILSDRRKAGRYGLDHKGDIIDL